MTETPKLRRSRQPTPRQVLRTIMADVAAPAYARIAAARALLALGRQQSQPDDREQARQKAVARRTLELVKGGKQ